MSYLPDEVLKLLEPEEHQHRWFRCLQMQSPRVDIFDCACGLRKKVYLGVNDTSPEIEVVGPEKVGSIYNCLHTVDVNFDTIGNPQADRMRSLQSGEA